jgi:nucleoid DNA-binding protein
MAALAVVALMPDMALAQGRGKGGPVKWMAPETMARGELVEAMASHAGLSEADAKKALDGFINATSSALRDHGTVYIWSDPDSDDDGLDDGTEPGDVDSLDPDDDGDGIPTVADFGAFSLAGGGTGVDGCPQDTEVVFEAGPAFVHYENPLAKEGGSQDTPALGRAASPARCEKPVPGATDHEIFARMVKEGDVPERVAALAYDAILAIIVDVVNDGGIVDLEGFGRFEATVEITATITESRGRPPLLVIDVWEHSVSLSGASDGDIDATLRAVESISKRAARTGRNPQTGKEIKIAAKNVVRFKAGAELSSKVN